MPFGENLKALREAKGMTQKALAEKLGLTPPSIVAYEGGNKKPSFDVLMGIAKELNASLDELCNNKREVRTWADAMQLVYALSECGYFVEIEDSTSRDEGDKQSNIRRIAFHDRLYYMEDGDEKVFLHYSDNMVNMGAEKGNATNRLFWFVSELDKMRKLHKSCSIDDELFSLWLEKTLNKYRDELIPEIVDFPF